MCRTHTHTHMPADTRPPLQSHQPAEPTVFVSDEHRPFVGKKTSYVPINDTQKPLTAAALIASPVPILYLDVDTSGALHYDKMHQREYADDCMAAEILKPLISRSTELLLDTKLLT